MLEWHHCHSWQQIPYRIITAMEFIVFAVVLLAIVALSVPFGADSRRLSPRENRRDGLFPLV